MVLSDNVVYYDGIGAIFRLYECGPVNKLVGLFYLNTLFINLTHPQPCKSQLWG